MDSNIIDWNIKEPVGLNDLQALVHHGCRIDCDLAAHGPVWVSQSILGRYILQIIERPVAKRSTGRGKNQTPHIIPVDAAPYAGPVVRAFEDYLEELGFKVLRQPRDPDSKWRLATEFVAARTASLPTPLRAGGTTVREQSLFSDLFAAPAYRKRLKRPVRRPYIGEYPSVAAEKLGVDAVLLLSGRGMKRTPRTNAATALGLSEVPSDGMTFHGYLIHGPTGRVWAAHRWDLGKGFFREPARKLDKRLRTGMNRVMFSPVPSCPGP